MAGERSPLDEIAKFLAAYSDTGAAQRPMDLLLPCLQRAPPGLPCLRLFLLRTKSALTVRLARAFSGSKRMRYNGTAKLQRSVRHAVVQTWMISTAAVLIAAIPIEHARGGELMDCEPQRVRGDGRHWAYRILDGRECWYPGQPGKPKDELRWSEAPSAIQESAVVEQPDVEARPPAQAPQRPDAVDQAEVEASPAAVPEPDIIKVMPDEWRAAAADQLMAFTCCWPDLPTAVSVPQPGPGGRQDQPPAWPLILLPLGLCAMWLKKLRRLLATDFARSSGSSWWRWWRCGPPRRAQCERRAQAPHAGRRCHQLTHQCSTPNQTGPHRRDYSASCSAQSPTGLADRGFLPQLSQSWRLASDEVPAD